MNRHMRQVSRLLSAILTGVPLFTHAEQIPCALTVIVKET